MSALSHSVPSPVSDCNTPHEIPAFLDTVDAQQEVEGAVIEPGAQKKKKKKKPKKSASAKARDAAAATANAKADEAERPPVLSISRNKHWRYISSYHVCPLLLFFLFAKSGAFFLLATLLRLTLAQP